MAETERKVLLALVQRYIKLQDEVVTLRLLLQERNIFTSEDYQGYLGHIRDARKDLAESAPEPDAQALEDLLRKLLDHEGPVQ